MLKKLKLILSILVLASMPFNVQAETLFGEFKRVPDQIERGFYMAGDFGLFLLTGAVNKNRPGETATNPGFALSMTLGYDIMKYISIASISTVGLNEADPNDPRLQGGVNSFLFNLAARGEYPMGRLHLYGLGGGGVMFAKPSFETNKDMKTSILLGGGLEYYTYLRHYSIFGQVIYYITQFPVNPIVLSLGLKYTF